MGNSAKTMKNMVNTIETKQKSNAAKGKIGTHIHGGQLYRTARFDTVAQRK